VKGLEVDYSLCVIGGLGHAGLPLSVVFACRGQRVLIYDRNTRAAEVVRAGRMPFVEERGEEHLREALASGNLDITDDIRAVSKARTVCVVIGTPVDDHLNPALEDVTDLVDELMPHLVDGQVVMLRSTVFPAPRSSSRSASRSGESGSTSRSAPSASPREGRSSSCGTCRRSSRASTTRACGRCASCSRAWDARSWS